MTTTTKATRRDIGGPDGHLAHMRAFTGNSLYGYNTGAGRYVGPFGWMPHEQRALFSEASERGEIVYVVIHYKTPVAWVIKGDSGHLAVIPAIKYSSRTSGYQSMIRAWLASRVPVSAP